MKTRSHSKASDHQSGEIFQEVLSRNIARRSFLKGALISAPLILAGPGALQRHFAQAAEESGLRFKPISLDNQDRVLIAEGYDVQVLIRWGDPVFRDSPNFNALNQSKLTQEHQFGYNCDYVAYLPLPHHRANTRTGPCCGSITSTLTNRLCFRITTFKVRLRHRSMLLLRRTEQASSKSGRTGEITGR